MRKRYAPAWLSLLNDVRTFILENDAPWWIPESVECHDIPHRVDKVRCIC